MSIPTDIEILLVEDNPHDAEMSMRTLRGRQLAKHIVCAKDGQEALNFLFGTGPAKGETVRPKLVLLDLKMPKVDGLEVLRAIRADPRTALLPVVMMSSSNEDRDVIESFRLGANSYVVKPVDFESFSAAVAELGHYWLSVNRDPSHRRA